MEDSYSFPDFIGDSSFATKSNSMISDKKISTPQKPSSNQNNLPVNMAGMPCPVQYNASDSAQYSQDNFQEQSCGPCNYGCMVMNACTNTEVPNVPCFPQTIKVPVVLAEPTLHICVMSDIRLEVPAIEVKRARKDAFLTQCKVLPTGHRCIFKLFVNGYIRENIEYATLDQCNPTALCGSIRHTTVQLPFSACSELQFPPCGPFPIFTKTEEAFTEFLDPCGRGPSLDKKLFSTGVFYNEQPYCELVCVNFQEYNIGADCCPTKCPETAFSVINEHIVMDLKVKVLQLQQMHQTQQICPTRRQQVFGDDCCQ